MRVAVRRSAPPPRTRLLFSLFSNTQQREYSQSFRQYCSSEPHPQCRPRRLRALVFGADAVSAASLIRLRRSGVASLEVAVADAKATQPVTTYIPTSMMMTPSALNSKSTMSSTSSSGVSILSSRSVEPVVARTEQQQQHKQLLDQVLLQGYAMHIRNPERLALAEATLADCSAFRTVFSASARESKSSKGVRTHIARSDSGYNDIKNKNKNKNKNNDSYAVNNSIGQPVLLRARDVAGDMGLVVHVLGPGWAEKNNPDMAKILFRSEPADDNCNTDHNNENPVDIICNTAQQEQLSDGQVVVGETPGLNASVESLRPVSAKSSRFDVGVVVSFGQMIPDWVLDALPRGAVNMHPSLLPRHRGASPVAHTLLRGDRETGVSVLEISRGRFDTGRILDQVRVPVSPDAIHSTLLAQLANIGAERVVDTLMHLNERQAHARPQEGVATQAPKLRREMGFVRWREQTAQDVFQRWQALGENVGIHTQLGKHTIRLRRVLPPDRTHLSYRDASRAEKTYEPGQLKYDIKQRLVFVRCRADTTGAAAWSAFSEVAVDGRVQSAETFANGFRFRNEREPSVQHMFAAEIDESK